MIEEWRYIRGYEGRYQVSDHGRIRSMFRNTIYILKPMVHYKGHLYVHLYNHDGIRDQLFVHRLVAEAFIDNWDNLAIVNHRHGDKQNNHVSNLEWTSPQGNTIHFYKGLETMEQRNAAF